jgi:predicted GNAT family acetyltransferase
MDAVEIAVRHNEAEQRFELALGTEFARADYRLHDGVMHLVHTEVPIRHEGRGIAARLVRTALEYAREKGLRVRPGCSYVRVYLRRHPEFDDLLA